MHEHLANIDLCDFFKLTELFDKSSQQFNVWLGSLILHTLPSGQCLQDKKSAESVCLAFARLVDNYHKDERLLKEIAAHGLLSGIQQLVSILNIT